AFRHNQIGLHEWHRAFRVDEPVAQFLGRQLAVLVEPVAPFRRQALDAGLHRNAARAAEEVEHVGTPQIDAGLDAEFNRPIDERLKEFAPRQENLVDERDVGCARRDEPVEFVEDRRERTAAIAVAEIVLGAEGAVIGTTARYLHLGAGPCRAVSKRWWW